MSNENENQIKNENHQIIKLKKKYYSHKKLYYSNDIKEIEELKSQKPKSNKFLITENNDKNKHIFKAINIKSHNNNDLNSSNQEEEILAIYKTIKRKIKDFITSNKADNNFIFSSLNYIYSFINSLFSSFSKKEDSNREMNHKENENKNYLKLLTINNDHSEIYKTSRKILEYNLLKKKILDLENKLKVNEFKYLLCIKEQQIKISDLEKQLKMKNIKEDHNEIKETRCFPHLIQYNYKDDINPKSVPLTKSILKDLNIRSKNRINTYKYKSHLKKNNSNKNKNPIKNNIIYNSKPNFIRTNYSSKYKKIIKKNVDNEEENYINSPQNKKSQHPTIKSVDILKKKVNLDEDDDKSNNYNNVISSSRIKQLSLGYEDDDINLKTLKDFNSDNIINKGKTYFISHPNLAIAGINNKKNKFSKGLPNKIFSFKFSKNLEKNAFFTFPSTLNETLVNLEKLKLNKNFIDKDDVI